MVTVTSDFVLVMLVVVVGCFALHRKDLNNPTWAIPFVNLSRQFRIVNYDYRPNTHSVSVLLVVETDLTILCKVAQPRSLAATRCLPSAVMFGFGTAPVPALTWSLKLPGTWSEC